jgi:hypothetical protein
MSAGSASGESQSASAARRASARSGLGNEGIADVAVVMPVIANKRFAIRLEDVKLPATRALIVHLVAPIRLQAEDP